VAFRNPENTLVAASRNATEGVPYRLNVSNAKKSQPQRSRLYGVRLAAGYSISGDLWEAVPLCRGALWPDCEPLYDGLQRWTRSRASAILEVLPAIARYDR